VATRPAAAAGVIGGVGVVAGILAALTPDIGFIGVGIVLGAPLALLVATMVRIPVLVLALVVSCQLTGGRFPLLGYHFLPEHVVLLLLGPALLLRSTGWLLRRMAAYEALLLAWVGWNAVVSLVYAVDTGASMAIVAWMFLAWLILWCLRSCFLADAEARDRAVRLGASIAASLGVFAFVLWVLAQLTDIRVAVQPDYVTGSVAAKGLASEANFLGSQLMFWLFLVVRARVLKRSAIPVWQVCGLVLGIAASLTRAVWLAAALMIVGAAVASAFSARRSATGPPSGARRPSALRGALAGLGIVALLLSIGSPAAQKLRVSLDFGSVTGRARVDTWKTAWNDIREEGSLVTGLGTNSFGQRHASPTLAGEPDYLGNLPLATLYDSGMIGAALLTAAFVALVLRSSTVPGRIFNLLFVALLMVVGAATSPVWFGFVWAVVAIFDSEPQAPRSPEVDPAVEPTGSADPSQKVEVPA